MTVDKMRLKSVVEHLNGAGYCASLLSPSDVTPFEQLYITLDPDVKGRPRGVQLQYIPVRASNDGDHLLQFVSSLPFELNASVAGDTARMVLLVNKVIELPGFGMSEIDTSIYYQHVHVCRKGHFEDETVGQLLSSILHYVDEFAPVVEEIAVGAKSFGAVVDAMKREMSAQHPTN